MLAILPPPGPRLAPVPLPRRPYPLRDPSAPLPPAAPVRGDTAKPSAQDEADVLACNVDAITDARFTVAADPPKQCETDWTTAWELVLRHADSPVEANCRLGTSLTELICIMCLRHAPGAPLPANLVRHRIKRFLRGD